MSEAETLNKKDFQSDQEVRWCPGCGDYAILSAVQGVCAELGFSREDTVFVSGIGCSSRFPYYMDTYGFHTIHGRAPGFATGIKMANPDLNVWMVTGDGDGMSIGGNHLAHILRRNVNVNILLFNNQVYGLTKGQYSPTSPVGQKSKTSPLGSIDRPFNPVNFALGANATFVARTIDTHVKHMALMLKAAAAHEGTSFVEIYQNCVIFNDGAFDSVADRKIRDDMTIDLRPGEPLVYGKELDKGLKFNGWGLERCAEGEAAAWDPKVESTAPAVMMGELANEAGMPRPIGIFRQIDAPAFEVETERQIADAKEAMGEGKLRDLIYQGNTWEVE